MIDFNNASFMKLKEVQTAEGTNLVAPMLVDGEEVLHTFKTIRDMVIFTNKRIISVNVQGITGTKKDFTSMPYSKIQVFSVETAGTLDLDAELTVWFSGVGKVKFEFKSNFDISAFNKLLSNYIL
ncbi:PH domain-containing protein [Lachnospiraceae bacterium MD329]|jgi:hypothetical protein|nr:PH domain-containing protein [Lachnospiraceae bacterium MD329]